MQPQPRACPSSHPHPHTFTFTLAWGMPSPSVTPSLLAPNASKWGVFFSLVCYFFPSFFLFTTDLTVSPLLLLPTRPTHAMTACVPHLFTRTRVRGACATTAMCMPLFSPSPSCLYLHPYVGCAITLSYPLPPCAKCERVRIFTYFGSSFPYYHLSTDQIVFPLPLLPTT